MVSFFRVLGHVTTLVMIMIYATEAYNPACQVDLGSYQVDLNPLASWSSDFSVSSASGLLINFRVCSNLTCANTPYGSVPAGVCQQTLTNGHTTSRGAYKGWMQATPLGDRYQSGVSLRLFGGTNGAQSEVNIYCDPSAWTPYNFSVIIPFDQHYPAIISMTHQSACRNSVVPPAGSIPPSWAAPSYWNPQPYWNPPQPDWNPQSPQPYWNPPQPYWNPPQPYWNPPQPYWNPPQPYWNPPQPYWNPQPYWDPPTSSPSYWTPPPNSWGEYAITSQLDFSPNNPTCGAGGRFTKNVWRFGACIPHPTMQNTYYMVSECTANNMLIRYNLDPYCMDTFSIKMYRSNVCTPRDDRGATLLLGCQLSNTPNSKVTSEEIDSWKEKGLIEALPTEQDMKL